MRYKEILPGVRITSDRCLVLDEGPTVVLGDLHLGYERALEQEGMYIPRINTDSIRDSLNNILCRYEPERVVLLGDVKHDFKRAGFEEKREVRRIVGLLAEAAETVVIKGNHDNYIQNIIADQGILALDHVDIMGFRLEHGHVDSGVRPVIIGHEHPSVRIPGSVGVQPVLVRQRPRPGQGVRHGARSEELRLRLRRDIRRHGHGPDGPGHPERPLRRRAVRTVTGLNIPFITRA